MSKELREPFLYISTGQKGVGKTYATEHNILKNYVNGANARPVIIFDTNNEFVSVKAINWDIEQYKPTKGNRKKERDYNKIGKEVFDYCIRVHEGKEAPKILRVVPFLKSGKSMSATDKQETAKVLMDCVRGGILYLEDFNNYFMGAKSMDIISNITTNRHKAQDIVLHLQTMTALDPKLIANSTVIRMHKQADPIKRIKNKLSNPEIFLIAEMIIQNEWDKKNKYFYLYLYPSDHKIGFYKLSAKECKQKFELGCIRYLTKNHQIFNDFAQSELQKSLSSLNQAEKTKLIKTFIKQKTEYITK